MPSPIKACRGRRICRFDARLVVIDEEELRNAPIDLRDALTETVDEPARADRSDKRLRLTIARVVGEAVTGKRRRIRQHVAGGVRDAI
jgi:hypothetical protein